MICNRANALRQWSAQSFIEEEANMFKRRKEKKLCCLTNAVREYVRTNYISQPLYHDLDVQFSSKLHVQYSISDDADIKSAQIEESQVRYQLQYEPQEKIEVNAHCPASEVNQDAKDNYSPSAANRFAQILSSVGSPQEALQVLKNSTNRSFVDKLLDYISVKHMRDAEVYKAAQIDRRLFSKIASDRTYKPAKDTCIALSFALQLTLSEANDILSRAGYALSHSSKRDIIIEYFFRERIYNLNDINDVLFRLEEKTIGR